MDDINMVDYQNMLYSKRSMAIACTRGREAIVSRFRDLLQDADLTEQQWRVMRILFDQEPISGVDLSRLSCIHKASMTRIYASLERRKFIQRIQGLGDSRSNIVKLTKYGRDTMNTLMPKAQKIYLGIIEDFGLERYQLLLELLAELSEINNK